MRRESVTSIGGMYAAFLFFLLFTASAVVGNYGVLPTYAQAGPGGGDDYDSELQRSIARKLTGAMSKRSVNQAGGYGTDSALGRMLSIAPLPGEGSYTSSSPIEEAKKYLEGNGPPPDFGKNNRSMVNVVLPPLEGFKALVDSDPIKDMLKKMVLGKVPVLIQTMHMVENGAATGYVAALNSVSNLMSNTIETQDFQLQLMHLTDDTGKMREAYVQRMKEAFTKDKAETWPAALYAAVGDSTEFEPGGGKGMRALPAPKAYTLKQLASDNASPGSSSQGDLDKKRLLSDLLFLQKEDQAAQAPTGGGSSAGGGGQVQYSNEELQQLKEEFVRLVGDVEIELKGEGQNAQTPDKSWLRTLNMNFIAPEQKDERRGVARENFSELQVSWAGINTILFNYCKFVKDNPNKDRKISQGQFKYTAATAKEVMGQGNDNAAKAWEYVSSPDIPITMSLIEALFHLVRHTEEAQQLDCEQLNLGKDDMPTTLQNGGGGGGAPGGGGGGDNVNLNECGKKKGCLRNRLILHMAHVIARSRTLHTYRTLHLLSKRFATDPALNSLVDDLFMRSMAGMNIDQELGANREAWEDFTLFLAKIVQGDSYAGSFHRPGEFGGGRGGAPEGGGGK